ncbi:hypothetical protein AB205_0050580, partial [Aquarana catesbeiana]
MLLLLLEEHHFSVVILQQEALLLAGNLDSENCMRCPDHEWPNENKTRCIPKQSEFLSFTDDMLSLVFIIISLLCFGKTLLVLVIFILHQDTPVVKANNKSVSFVLLVSIMLGFLCVFLFLGHPVDVTCLLRQISFGILFTIAVSSVLAKTIMVCIAFKATKPNSMTLPDSFNEAKYITFSMLVFCNVWIAMIPAYLSTKGKYTLAVEIFAILISNSGLLYCMFLAKCFIIFCRPELNTKGRSALSCKGSPFSTSASDQTVPVYEDYEYVQDGDIIIGGVFTVNCLMAGWRIPEKPNVTGMLCL